MEDIVYDPFMGAGTTAFVAKKYERHYLGSELNSDYIDLIEKRLTSKFIKHLFY
jgi:site-specific DNA-methyltransferase (adenine-specific)